MKKLYAVAILVLVLLGTASCQSTPPDTTAANDGQLSVIKSQNDQRDYEYFELENRLRVLVISDPEAKKAAVSLDVGTGSKDDPLDREGLAHFLEHMLFLGTQKYPTAGEYQEFISTHGGQHNAYTSFENTNYFFDINTAFLEPALDRFSQFFIDPLFTAKYVEREKHAVESEYRAKYKDEARRGVDALKEVVNPEHPFAKFSVGSLDTLADRPEASVRDDLLSFYAQNYSANRMTLVVLGSVSTAELRAMVEQRFSQVEDRDLADPEITAPIFAEGVLPAMMLVTPEQDIRNLDMSFPVADPRPYWQAKPVHMIADILGHEGEGSLLQYLKQQGYAEALSAGAGLQYNGGSSLNLSIKLTELGYANRDKVVAAVFQAINRMSAEGITEQRFEEQSKVSEIQFRYQDKRENIHYVMGLATAMKHYPAAELLYGPYMFADYQSALYQQYLDQLSPENVLITVTGPDLATDRVSILYQTPYTIAPLAPEQLQTLRTLTTNSQIVMPGPNLFIPEQFDRLDAAGEDSVPKQIVEADNLRIWYGDNSQFAAPRASMRIGFYSPLANDSARNAVLLQLYAAMVSDQLNPKLYPALLTGFSARLNVSRRGMQLGIDGFSDKQMDLLEMMLAEIEAAPFSAQRFEDIKQDLMRGWQNRKRQAPYQYLSQALRRVMYTPQWNEDDKLAVAEGLTLADLQNYRAEFLDKIRIDILSYGNISKQQALALQSRVEPMLKKVKGTVVLPGVDLVVLADNSRYRYALSLEHGDAAIAYYVQGKSDDNDQRVLMGLTGQIIRTPYYHSLRTEQQFGYIVYAATTVLERTPGLSFIVQSPVADAATLVSATDKLLQQFEATAEAMSVSEFEQHKTALRSMINRPHKNLAHEAGFLWDQIQQSYYEFDRRQQLTLALDALELEQWRGFYRDNFLPLPARALIVTQLGNHQQPAGAWEGTRLIKNADSFKQSQQQRHYP